MATINVDSEKMTKVAQFVAQAAPMLEKLAAEKQALATAAPTWVDELIGQGLLKKEARENAINELVTGGISKVSEVVEYLINNVGPRTSGQPSDKTASATPTKGQRDSDAAFERAILDQ